jgi:hypothetical protein
MDAVKANVDAAFDRLPLGAVTDFENSYNAALKIARDNKGKIGKLPKIIQKILQEYAPIPTKNGTKRPKARLKVLMNDLATLTQEISAAVEAGRNNDARMMREIKSGMEADFDAVGNMWEQVNAARQLYRNYAETYLHGTLGTEMSATPSKDVTFRLDTILNGKSGTPSVESPHQLRAAMNDNPEGIQAVVDHLLSKMADVAGKSSESLRNWRNSDKIARIIDAFPEARDPINAAIRELRDLENQSQTTREAIRSARDVPEARADPAEIQRANRIAEETRVEAQRAYTLRTQQGQTAAFTSFVGNNPHNAVQAVMSSGDPVQTAQQIMRLCQADPSGEAALGFQNALRQFVRRTVRRTGEVTGSSNDPNVPIQPNEFAISLKKANDALNTDSLLRQVMEVVLPREQLQALDTVRRQIEILARPTRNTGGQSPTAPQGAFSTALQEEMDKNVIGLLGRIARGWSVDKSVSTKTSRMLDNLQRFYFGQADVPVDKIPGLKSGLKSLAEEFAGWSGKDVATRCLELLSDAMLNPQLAADILESRIASPRARALFRAYFINRDQLNEEPPTLPFNSLNTTETQLPNGNLIRDRSTGYLIQNNGKKYVVKNYKDQKVGIYNDLEEARNAAVKDWSKPTNNIKLRKD